MKALTVIAAALALVGSARAAPASQTLAQYERQSIEQLARGHWGKLYDTLHPAQQKIISRRNWSRCMDATEQFDANRGIDLSSARFVRFKAEPGKKTIVIPGTAQRVRATVVRTWWSTVDLGRRQVGGGHPEYVVKVNGAWRSIEQDLKPADFEKKGCGLHPKG